MSFQPVVLAARSRLQAGRDRIQLQHDAGSPGFQVSTRIADLYDNVVLEVWDAAIEKCQDADRVDGIALVAHGGFGRRDLAPYSDADLMLLSTNRSSGLAAELAGHLTRDLVDAGLEVGFSIRDPREACTRAWADAVIFSSLSESRFLVGSLHVYRAFFDRLRKGAQRRRRRLTKSVVEARREERQKWGETNYLLRPNVKRSRGALRDIQLVRWLGFIRCGECDLESLHRVGTLASSDLNGIRRAYAFMLRLRNDLHFRDGRSQDVLDRGTQLEIAEKWGYQASEGVLAVEHFMQDYFEHTQNVRYVAAFVADDTLTQSSTAATVERIISRRLTPTIRMGPHHIWVTDSALDSFASSLPDVIHLMSLANRYTRRISHKTWQSIRAAMQVRKPSVPSVESVDQFLGLLGQPGRLASLLRRLHELRVLEQLIPEIKRCRGLLQFNAYHKYTVDTHCIRAVEAATDMEGQTTSMGRRYRRLKDKTILHLALLIHDLGKGYEEDHCEVGKRIAKDVADYLGLDNASGDTLQWLVHKHLIVNVAAFRHDLNDSQVVVSFAREVGSIHRLELLIVHSVADLVAVGPGVATDWKMNLIEDLYLRTRRYFESGTLPDDNDPRTEERREEIRNILRERDSSAAADRVLNRLPLAFLRKFDQNAIVDEIERIGEWYESNAVSCCVGTYDATFAAVRYTVLRREDAKHIGTFARSTGVFTGLGLKIMRAEIDTIDLDDCKIALDSFWVIDPDFPDDPPQPRIDEVCDTMIRLLTDDTAPLAPPRKTWKPGSLQEPDSVLLLPNKVEFDNETLDQYTILSLFAYDDLGLLFRIASVLADESIVLHFAKIDTHLAQIADVFYVTESDGSRIEDPIRQQLIRDALLEAIVETVA